MRSHEYKEGDTVWVVLKDLVQDKLPRDIIYVGPAKIKSNVEGSGYLCLVPGVDGRIFVQEKEVTHEIK
jgi:hypothetical protein